MKISQAGIDLIKRFEGCKLDAYLDIVGVPTIGYGCTSGVKIGQSITEAQAEQMLVDTLGLFECSVSSSVKVPLTQSQFDALVSFSYNVGSGAFARSTMLKLINDGNFTAAYSEFKRWNMAGNNVIPGLTRRRLAEAELFGSTVPLSASPLPVPIPTVTPSLLTVLINLISSLFKK